MAVIIAVQANRSTSQCIKMNIADQVGGNLLNGGRAPNSQITKKLFKFLILFRCFWDFRFLEIFAFSNVGNLGSSSMSSQITEFRSLGSKILIQ